MSLGEKRIIVCFRRARCVFERVVHTEAHKMSINLVSCCNARLLA